MHHGFSSSASWPSSIEVSPSYFEVYHLGCGERPIDANVEPHFELAMTVSWTDSFPGKSRHCFVDCCQCWLKRKNHSETRGLPSVSAKLQIAFNNR